MYAFGTVLSGIDIIDITSLETNIYKIDIVVRRVSRQLNIYTMTANIISTHHCIYYRICIQHCPIIDFLFIINYSEPKSLVRFVCNKFRITRQYFHAITKIDIVEIKCRIYEKKKKKNKEKMPRWKTMCIYKFLCYHCITQKMQSIS